MKIRFKKLTENAVMPKKAHPTDAGFDLVATSRVFDKYGTVTYGTGLAVEIPEGYAGFIYPRSSIFKYDLALSNSVGVIDASYRGEIMAKFRPTLVFVDKDSVGDKFEGTDQTDLDTQAVTFNGRDNSYPDIPSGCQSFKPRVYEVGDRICQLIVMPNPEIVFDEADELSESDRGAGGYGSTGR